MSRKTIRRLSIVNSLLAAVMFSVIFWQGIRLEMMAYNENWFSIETNTPLFYPYLILPIGCGLMVITSIVKALNTILNKEAE